MLQTDLRKLTSHSSYLESAKNDLEASLIEKQKALDSALRESKALEQRL